ncbi:MAG: hypothetical protein FWG84_00040 [Bacteroidales bacterium]|nr:hypothetical protein [Bacteroidales bacterium]
MSKHLHFYEIVAGADNSRAMESETIQKNGASPKSLMSRGNFLINALLLIVFVVSLTSCGGGGISGTWNAEYQNSPEYPTSFTFSGKSFTLKQFAIINNHIYCYTHEEMEKAKIVKDNRGGARLLLYYLKWKIFNN